MKGTCLNIVTYRILDILLLDLLGVKPSQHFYDKQPCCWYVLTEYF